MKTEIRIQTLSAVTNSSKVGKKELDNPSKIIDMHKSSPKSKTHEVSGRKGMDPSVDQVTEMSTDHVQDLKSLQKTDTTTTVAATVKPSSTTATTTLSSKPLTTSKSDVRKEEIVTDNTPKTSLLGNFSFNFPIFLTYNAMYL